MKISILSSRMFSTYKLFLILEENFIFDRQAKAFRFLKRSIQFKIYFFMQQHTQQIILHEISNKSNKKENRNSSKGELRMDLSVFRVKLPPYIEEIINFVIPRWGRRVNFPFLFGVNLTFYVHQRITLLTAQ